MRKKSAQARDIPEDWKNRIRLMARATWDAIGCDSLACSGKRTMRRTEVIEIVQDANFMAMYGMDEEAYAYWRKLPPDVQDYVVGLAFPVGWYGM